MSYQNRSEYVQRLAELCKKREALRAERYGKLVSTLGEEAVLSLKEYFDLYNENLYLWFSGLWDNGIGAFYYSNSARDTEWYLPDIESTVQIMRALVSVGLIPNGKMSENIPYWLRDRLVSFTRGLQDKDDGYFYMSQWGKEEITTSRRGRDLFWAVGFLEELGGAPLYPTPISTGNKNAPALPEHLRTPEAFSAYLSGLDIGRMSYHYGNLLQSQAWQIKAAGEEFVDMLISWLDDSQNSENGLWQNDINYDSVNGLMKIALVYSQLTRPIPNAHAALKSAISAAISDEELSFICQVYNPLVCIQCLLSSVRKTEGDEAVKGLRDELYESAATLIRITTEKMKKFRKDDGSFSYHLHSSAARSQGAPIAPAGNNEGDANSTTIAAAGVTNTILKIFNIDSFPLYIFEEGELLFELMAGLAPVEKKIYSEPPELLPPQFKV